MSLRYFGTDGIRGEYGGPLLNDERAFQVGVAAANFARKQYETDSPILLIGRDTRQSGLALQKALASGFASKGGAVRLLGVAPTPAIAFACGNSDSHMACSITASHNPQNDNGFKFFQSNGTKLDEAMERFLDDLVGEAQGEKVAITEAPCGDANGLLGEFSAALVNRFGEGLLANRTVALDCANGATSGIAAKLFEDLGAKVVVTASDPNGTNINDGVGSERPESLKTVLSTDDFDYGFAFDGDGDRVVVFDENGVVISGEAVMAALAISYKEGGRLAKDTLVTTNQSNLGLDFALGKAGISVEREDIGDKFVSRKMLAETYSLGGEESGHLIIGEFSMTGDGLCSALSVAKMVEDSGRTLSELASVYAPFPQSSKSVLVTEKPALETCSNLQSVIADLEKELGAEGRLLIRYSGTEPKLRLLVEAKEDAIVKNAMERLLEAVGQDLTLA